MKLILDNMEKKLNSYSVYNGKFINSISNDTVVSIQQLRITNGLLITHLCILPNMIFYI